MKTIVKYLFPFTASFMVVLLFYYVVYE